MKKNGFTLIEFLVVLTIGIVIVGLIFGGVAAIDDKEKASDLPVFFAPEFENAKSQRQIANELKRQNDLLERQLNMKAEQE